VYAASGLLCSVGISGDKTTSKFAAKLQKPNGLTIIPPWEARERLADQPTTALCGIADGIGNFLAQHGAFTCGDVGKLPISVLARRFGNLGRRIWLMCQGEDPDQIHMDVAPPKSLGHGKVMPPGTRDKKIILTYLQHMSEKVGKRLRKYNLESKHYFIGLKTDHDWISDKLQLSIADNNGKSIYRLCRFQVENHWHGEPVRQVQVTALNPVPRKHQLDLFAPQDEIDIEINAVMDEVNERFGEFALAPARLLKRSSMPNVIAPAWKPDGLRQTI
ncbi:MAG: DNA polymerase IV, partial [Gammaproteobacteria bacterium]|nr:DNA polymerase IV [Gammaproteobacteria bacterium]